MGSLYSYLDNLYYGSFMGHYFFSGFALEVIIRLRRKASGKVRTASSVIRYWVKPFSGKKRMTLLKNMLSSGKNEVFSSRKNRS